MTLPALQPPRRRLPSRPGRGHALPAEMNRLSVVRPCGAQLSEGASALPTGALPIGAVLAGRVLRDGETVILMLKPSIWFLLLTCWKFLLAVSILGGLASRLNDWPRTWWLYSEACVFLICGRLMLATIQWMARLYILTDRRIIRVTGIRNVNVAETALRDVASAEVGASIKERLFHIGTIFITPCDERAVRPTWQMVAHPRQALVVIQQAIEKARHGGRRDL